MERGPLTPLAIKERKLTLQVKLWQLSLSFCILTSCSTPSTPEPAESNSDSVDKLEASEPEPLPVSIPDTAGGRQLTWVLSTLNDHKGQVNPGDIVAHFNAAFLAKAPEAQLTKLLSKLGNQLVPVTLTAVDATAGQPVTVGHVETKGGKLRIIIRVDPTNEKMSGLLFQPETGAGK